MMICHHSPRRSAARILAPIVTCLAALAGICSTAVAEEDLLAGSEWRPLSIGAMEIADDTGLYVRFEADGAIAGHGGCNRFFGSYTLDSGRIVIGPLAATRMACPEPVMQMETRFLAMLEGTHRFDRDRVSLSLFDENDRPVATLAQTDWD